MNFFKRAFKYCIRQRTKNMILFCIMSVIAIFLILSVSILTSSKNASLNVKGDVTGKLQLTIDETGNYGSGTGSQNGMSYIYNGDKITPKLIEAISKVEGVVDYNSETKECYYGAAVNFKYFSASFGGGFTPYGDASGITLSSRLSEYCPDIQIIFVSQYLKYVSPVYETAHTYFIYKPELELYLKPAVQKALQKIEEHSHLILTLSWNKKKTEILQKDICYMERLLRKTAVYTLHDTFYTAEKLSSILAQLSPSFTLCHRSYLINLEQLSAFLPGYLCLKDGRQIPVSRSYIQSVREQFLQIYRD